MDENLNQPIDELNPKSKADEMSEEDTSTDFYKLIFPLSKAEDISDEIKRYGGEIGAEELNRQFSQVGSYAEVIRRMSSAITQQSEFICEALDRLKDNSTIGESYEHNLNDGTEGYVLKNSEINVNRQFTGNEVSSKEAKMYILGRNGNIRKIVLYNSGFYIVIRAPRLIELNLLYNNIGTDFESYGRLIGALFYTYSDLTIKQHIVDFIHELIIGSNFDQWDRKERLLNCISIHDYQLILLNIAALMYKNGYMFKSVCLHCKDVTEMKIDLNLLQLTDFSRIPDEQRRWLAKGGVVKYKDIVAYQKSLGLYGTIDIGDYRVNTKIPSINEYLTNGIVYNKNLMTSIHDLTDDEDIQRYLRYSYCSFYESWIKSAGVIDYENPQKVLFSVSEKDGIKAVVEEIQNSGLSEEFSKKMSDFISDTSITNIGYLASPCQKCDTMPSHVHNGFVSLDIQNAFFSVLVMRLIQD